MSDIFWLALGLMLIFEGIGPLLFPNQWREIVRQMSEQPGSVLRRIGGSLVVAGLVICYVFSSK